jgi:hypothetical protein
MHKDKSRCHEFIKQGILKQITAKAISASDISKYLDIKMQLRCPVATTTLPDPWNSSCKVSENFSSISTY